jgi:hypothetical protein
MKFYLILSVFIFSSFYLNTQQPIDSFSKDQIFLQNKLEAADMVMVDVVEEVCKAYTACTPENLEQIKVQIQDLFNNAEQKKDGHSRVYSFVLVNNLFKASNGNGYLHYTLLCAELDPFILRSMSSDEISNLEQIIIQKLDALYAAQKLSIEEIIPTCYVSCVQVGVEKLELS